MRWDGRAGADGTATARLAGIAQPEAWPQLGAQLAAWMPAQRWFQGKARSLAGLGVRDAAVLTGEGADVVVLVVETAYERGSRERYQVPLVASPAGSGGPPGAVAATVGGVPLLDAVADPAGARTLAGWTLRAEGSRSHREAEVLGRPVAGHARTPGEPVRPMGVEQSNSSVVLGDAVLKVFRKLEDGPNPDVEVTRALTAAGFAHVPAQRGALVLARGDTETTLAVLSEFAAGAEEGWALACAEAARVAAGTGAGEAMPEGVRDLGEVVARMHVAVRDALDSPPAFSGAAAGWAERMRRQADEVLALARSRAPEAASAVLDGAGALGDRFDAVADRDEVGPLVRIHGDLHLGQVLRHGGRWLLLDFEGEPARSLEERRRPHSPLRDVAGMLRSFDYAAAHADPAVPEPLAAWRDRLRSAFLEAYLDTAGAAGLLPGPAATRALLDAFELDKAVYELGYELANRPQWIPIPLGGILRVLDGRD